MIKIKLVLPYEITKLFDIRIDPLTGERTISLKRNYAFPIEENFKAIKKFLSDLVSLENFDEGATWKDWTPTYSAEPDMTFTSVTTRTAKYCIIDEVVFFMLGAYGTTGGTASHTIYFTPPINSDEVEGGGCKVEDGDGKVMSGIWTGIIPSKFAVRKYDKSNWGLGADRGIYVQGFYKIK